MINLLFFIFIFIASLFIFYILCENDFILIRRNMTLFLLFNKIFIAIFAGFVFGRIFYILDTYNTLFVHPLVFFNYFKFQGFSLFGAFMGSILAMTYLIKDKKTLGRVLDITAISFYPYLFFYFFSKPFTLWYLVIQFGIIIIAILLFILFNYLHKNYSLQDSS